MSSHHLIDAQFDRAVEIVQGLPKTGPIQTDYEEKLAMYSLYKQATVGNVKLPRPGIWDMLGRAKWDAWAKHRDLDPYQAKWLYVEALMKVLRKYSDKTVATTFVQELESYGGDPSHIVMSGTLQKSSDSASSGSIASEDITPHYPPGSTREVSQRELQDETDSSSEEEGDDEAHELPGVNAAQQMAQNNRPPSSLSSHRYRTPMAGSLAMSPPPLHNVPSTQPLPVFETPSAFAEPTSAPSSVYPTSSPYAGHMSAPSRGGLSTPGHLYPIQPLYRAQIQSQPSHYGPPRPASRPTLERAVENVQAHLAALAERLESLEARSYAPRSHISVSPRGISTPAWASGRGSPNDGNSPRWDIDDLGLWSHFLSPMSRGIDKLRDFAAFFARNENRSPTMIIVRRLCLDVSFLLCVIAVVGALWRKSGVRRKEVRVALIVLWRAIIGKKPGRSMVDRGV